MEGDSIEELEGEGLRARASFSLVFVGAEEKAYYCAHKQALKDIA